MTRPLYVPQIFIIPGKVCLFYKHPYSRNSLWSPNRSATTRPPSRTFQKLCLLFSPEIPPWNKSQTLFPQSVNPEMSAEFARWSLATLRALGEETRDFGEWNRKARKRFDARRQIERSESRRSTPRESSNVQTKTRARSVGGGRWFTRL